MKTIEQTKQYYRNAINTGYSCGGHHKAERNKALSKQYKETIEKAGAQVPTLEDCFENGVFNGQGSY